MNGRPIALGAAAVSSGLLGGVLFGFSSFVMPALRRIPACHGVSAMQSINRQATSAAFGSLMAASVVLAAGVGGQAVLDRDEAGARWVVVGSLCVAMAAAITVGFNVPRNNRLATFDAVTPEAARYWSTFLAEWILANHLRTALCVAASSFYTVALRQSR
jgi:uncharacterized membrane protein